MDIILYIPKTSGWGEKILQITRAMIPGHEVEIIHSADELAVRMRHFRSNIGIALLSATTEADLEQVIDLADILGELRVVLILPDGESGLLEKAQLLRPQFVASTESDFKYLGEILKRMIDLYSH